MSFLFSNQATAENEAYLGLVAQWENTYGSFSSAIKIWEYKETQEGKVVNRNYAFCPTSKGVVILDVDGQSVVSFIPLGDCEDLDIANPLLPGDTDPNLPPVGDYDGDRMINFMEYHLATSPINPTVSLPLRQGKNLYYFPVIDKGNSITAPPNVLLRPYYAYDQSRGGWYYSDNNKHFQRVCYYYDSDENTWQEEKNCSKFVDAFTQNIFNALNATTGGVLYLDLYNPISPILYLRGFSCPWSFDVATNLTPNSDTELFNPNEFNQGVKIKEILHNLEQIETISCPNKKTGLIDSAYRFFEKSAGNSSNVRQDGMYIIYKKGRIP